MSLRPSTLDLRVRAVCARDVVEVRAWDTDVRALETEGCRGRGSRDPSP